MAEEKQPDLILIEPLCYRVDGLELIRALKENKLTQKIPIIAITVLAQAKERCSVMASGCDDYLSKSYDVDDLNCKIRYSDVLIHYQQNVLPQVMKLIQTYNSNQYLIIEGSALYPSLVTNIVNNEKVRGIWLVGNYSLLKNRIFFNSNFYNAGKKKYLIYKFLERTSLYNQAMINDLKELEFKWIQVNSKMAIDEPRDRCCQELAIIW